MKGGQPEGSESKLCHEVLKRSPFLELTTIKASPSSTLAKGSRVSQ